MERAVLRGLAAVGGVVCLGATAWTALVVGVISSGARAPNRFEPDGDPCCWRPDTWGETALGSLATLLAGLVPALIATVGAGLATWAVNGRRARARRLVWVFATILIATVVLIAVTLGTTLDDMRT
jgi:hypothetical protein